MNEEEWKNLRSRRKVLRFSQEFLMDLLKEYGDLPKNTVIRGVKEDFDTADIMYLCLNPDWPKVHEGQPAGRINVTFDLPKHA